MERVCVLSKKAKNISGKKYGRLTALYPIKIKNRRYVWLCECDCGNRCESYPDALGSGEKQSCGCLNKEVHTKHGMKGTRFYRIYIGMKSRCSNEKVDCYKDYGGRGIKVDDRWMDFRNFKNDMYESYLHHINKHGEHNTTIERINVNDNYSKDNCVWGTWKKQANNRSNTKRYWYKGEFLTPTELADKYGLNYHTLAHRLRYQKLSVDEAVKRG